ncbi:MAG TPA: PIN domain-containing protein [Thermoanaerobaculia bacterium]|nr:PIN domain-containing protein [Thermoanaerobaculia bacterium]
MIAIDTSSWVAFFSGASGEDVDLVGKALAESQACLVPVVLTELLSDPQLPARVAALFKDLPMLEVTDGYWERAGVLRSEVLSRKLKARLADTLIAQSCLDHDVTLVSRDSDFRHFAAARGLALLG